MARFAPWDGLVTLESWRQAAHLSLGGSRPVSELGGPALSNSEGSGPARHRSPPQQVMKDIRSEVQDAIDRKDEAAIATERIRWRQKAKRVFSQLAKSSTTEPKRKRFREKC